MEKYSRPGQREGHPLKKYVGRLANCCGAELEVVGYSYDEELMGFRLIVGASAGSGWSYIGRNDVIFKECEGYRYARISDLVDYD